MLSTSFPSVETSRVFVIHMSKDIALSQVIGEELYASKEKKITIYINTFEKYSALYLLVMWLQVERGQVF